MKWLSTFTVLLAIQVTLPRIGHANSCVAEVTPENVEKLPLNLRVETEVYQDGTGRFDVFVSAREDKISPRREGRLEIARQMLPKTKPGENPTMLPPTIWCGVQVAERAGVLEFTFGVDREMLPRASFQFRNYEPSGMPSMDVYSFRLEEFAPAK